MRGQKPLVSFYAGLHIRAGSRTRDDSSLVNVSNFQSSGKYVRNEMCCTEASRQIVWRDIHTSWAVPWIFRFTDQPVEDGQRQENTVSVCFDIHQACVISTRRKRNRFASCIVGQHCVPALLRPVLVAPPSEDIS